MGILNHKLKRLRRSLLGLLVLCLFSACGWSQPDWTQPDWSQSEREALEPVQKRDSANTAVVSVSDARSGMSLAGNWHFMPGDDVAWAMPGYDDASWHRTAVPGFWPEGGYPETEQMAWYRLTLQFDPGNLRQQAELSRLGIGIGRITSAYEVYAGGSLLGGVGKLPPLGEVNYDRAQVYEIPRSAIGADGVLVLALRVWGGPDLMVKSFGAGIARGDIGLGEYATLLQYGVAKEMPTLLIAVLFLSFGIYHIYLFRRNRQLQSYLWFGLMAINIGIYALMLSQWRYQLGWSFVTYEKIEFGAIYLFPAIAMQSIWALLDLPIGRLLRVYQAGFVASAIMVLGVPGLDIHYYSLTPWQLYVIPLVGYAPWVMLREARAGNAEAKTALVGVFIFVATAVNDLALDLAQVNGTRMLPYGFVAIMLSMAVSMANRFTTMLTCLEEEVAERTLDLSQSNARLAQAARHDPLTGIFNRRGFTEHAELEMKRVSRSGREFTVMLADIDNFKQFNDSYGHACGDHVLCRVSKILGSQMRDVDRVARWGGEEFIFLLPETDADGAAVLAEKLREDIAGNLFEFAGERMGVTVTLGIAVHRKGEKLDSTIARADTALYHGKKRGRNRVMIGSYKGLTLVS
jgi:diguanylate cyclase (GGDEF)-like protein